MNNELDGIDGLIDSLINHTATLDPSSKEFKDGVIHLKSLIDSKKALTDLAPKPWRTRIFGNPAVVNSITTIVIAVLMLNYEKTDVVTSSVRGFIRPR